MADLIAVTKSFAVMSLAWPNYKAMDGTIEVYASVFEDIPVDALQAAAKKLIASGGEFFPSASLWRQTALDIMLNKRGLPSSMEAWEELIRMGDGSQLKGLVEVEPGKWAVTREDRTWKYPLVEKVAIRCGWPDFPNPDPDKISYDRTVFIRAYENELARVQEDLRTLPEVKQVEQNYLTAGVKALAEGKRL